MLVDGERRGEIAMVVLTGLVEGIVDGFRLMGSLICVGSMEVCWVSCWACGWKKSL